MKIQNIPIGLLVKMYYLFADGGCRGNGSQESKATYGFVLYNDMEIIYQEAGPIEGKRTNNTAELTALIKGMDYCIDNNISNVEIISDSNYSIKILTQWGDSWKRKGWKKSDGKTPENLDLIKTLLSSRRPGFSYKHVRGHSNGDDFYSIGNNIADRLLNEAMDMED